MDLDADPGRRARNAVNTAPRAGVTNRVNGTVPSPRSREFAYDFLEMPVPPWEEDEGVGEQSLVDSDATPLQEIVVRFGITLTTPGGASAFARLFGFMYKRSGVTARDNVAWLTFVCAAADAREAAVQALVAVETVSKYRRLLGGERPVESHFYDVQVSGPVRAYDLVHWRSERAEALAKARAWGLLDEPLVHDAEKAVGASAETARRRKKVAARGQKRRIAPPTRPDAS